MTRPLDGGNLLKKKTRNVDRTMDNFAGAVVKVSHPP